MEPALSAIGGEREFTRPGEATGRYVPGCLPASLFARPRFRRLARTRPPRSDGACAHLRPRRVRVFRSG